MWKPDPRTLKHIGDYTVVSETNGSRETAHLIDLGDKFSRIRVLPSERYSGLKRSVLVQDTVRRAAEALVGGSEALVEPYLSSQFDKMGLEWEYAEPDLIAWLREWFWIWGEDPAEGLVHDLAEAGWEIVWQG